MPSKPRAPEAESKDGKPMKWWQWFIVYPTIATSFFAAIPTATNYAKSLALGVKPSQVSDAETQNKLWEKNADCLINAKGLSIKTPQAFEVAATVCPNGDILLAGKRADSELSGIRLRIQRPRKSWLRRGVDQCERRQRQRQRCV